VLGRTIRPQGTTPARTAFAEAAEVAAANGLDRWHLRAQQELSMEDFEGQGIEGLIQTRDLAARFGAHITVAVMDLIVADLALAGYDQEGCARAATACAEASRRYGLATGPVADLWLAGAHALAGDDAAMQEALDAALAPDPDDPRILGDRAGRVLVARAFVRDELETLPALLDEMIGHVRRAPPTTSIFIGRVTWALLHAIDDADLGAAARAEYRTATSSMGAAVFEAYDEAIEAVVLGRSGDPAGASARMAPAYDQLAASPLAQGLLRTNILLVSRAAIRDGWGDPVRWLRDSEAWFAAHGYGALVRRARSMLGDAGAAVPRRGRGESEVPESLRALGVTSRETDVLKLVVARRSNKEIAAELYLSPKTVERHLTSLFDRTGVRNRQALAELGEGHLS
jgi:DNA-binding CsgD family transcriptional regulator